MRRALEQNQMLKNDNGDQYLLSKAQPHYKLLT